jgi:hypothetical protein
MGFYSNMKYILAAVLLLIGLTACSGGADTGGGAYTGDGAETDTDSSGIVVQDPWVRPAVMTGMSDMEQDEAATDTETEGEMSEGEMSEGEISEGEMSEGEMQGGMAHSGGGNSAAYMTLVNNSDTDAAVVSAATDVATTVELHTTERNEQGVMSMRPIEQIDIPAGGETALQPGGIHVMLIDLTQDLEEGDMVDLTLTLQSGEELQISAPVGQPAE